MIAVTYIIEPIEGRAAIQKNFVKLPERAPKYSNRHVTLNERFSIIERGYYLKPVNLPQKRDKLPRVSFVPMNSIPPDELIASSIAKLEKKRLESERVKAKGQEVSPCKESSYSALSVPP